MRTPRYSAFNISTRCRSPTERADAHPSGSTGRPSVPTSSSFSRALRGAGKWPPERLAPEHHVIKHAQVVGQREVLVHHADAGVERDARVAGRQRLAEHFDIALVGDVVLEQDRHQR